MSHTSFHLSRVGLGITFLWIAVLIVADPEGWGGLLQPWAAGLLPLPLKAAMVQTAILDGVIGFLFLVDLWTWLAALLAAIHLCVVLAVTGITPVTVRDIGLLAVAVGLFLDAMPGRWRRKVLRSEQ